MEVTHGLANSATSAMEGSFPRATGVSERLPALPGGVKEVTGGVGRGVGSDSMAAGALSGWVGPQTTSARIRRGDERRNRLRVLGCCG